MSARIGVDARPLSHPGTGIYRHTHELLSRMCRLGGEWYLYSAQDFDATGLDLPNVHRRIMGLSPRLRASQLAHFCFPLWARRDRLSVFWGTRHQLPLVLPAGLRKVVTVNDMVWKVFGDTMRFPGRQIEAFFMPRALAAADRIAVISEFTADEVTKYFPQYAAKLSVVPCASVLQGMPARPVDGEACFLFVGTLEPRKNLPRLLRAYARLVHTYPTARKLKIAGAPGWGGQDIAALVDKLGLQARVEILGAVAEDRLASLYAEAYALLMPSLYEGFGLPVVEALSAGVPALVSRDSAMSEVAGLAGLPVDPLSEQGIADALLRLSTDSNLYSSLAGEALNESRRYDWDRSAVKMFAILMGDAGSGRT
jgi:glycosyltransferase involved in cell wall biosynthesis